MFNIGKMKMTGWSKKASKAGLPQQWQKMPTKVINILFDPYCKDMMMLQSHDMFVLLDTTKVSRFVASHLYSLIIARILEWDFLVSNSYFIQHGGNLSVLRILGN